MGLIDRKALIDQMESHIYWGDSVIGLLEVAKNTPTIEAEPVRHGRCPFCDDLDKMTQLVCYLPHERDGGATDVPVNYCPN